MRALPIALAVLIATPALAHAESRVLELGAFTEVDIATGIVADITVGSAQSIVAEGLDPTDLDILRTEVRDGKLYAWIDWNIFDLFNLDGRQVNLTITVPALTSVGASMGSVVTVAGMGGDTIYLGASKGAVIDAAATGKAFTIEAYDGADVTVQGACESAIVAASSGAELHAKALECSSAHVTGDSGASIEVFTSTLIKAEAAGGSSIVVHGKPPTVEESEGSGGEVDIR